MSEYPKFLKYHNPKDADGNYKPPFIWGETTLDQSEQDEAFKYVEYLKKAEPLKHAKERLVGDDLDKHQMRKLNGCGAEIAFSKMFGGICKLGLRENNWDDDNGDCKLWGGYTVDVKLNSMENHWAANDLIIDVRTMDKSTVDVFAAMKGEFPTYTFNGFCPRDEVEKRAYKKGQIKEADGYPVNYYILKTLEHHEIDWSKYKRLAQSQSLSL